MTKEYLFGIQDYHKATWGQNFVASIAGAVASITVAAPLDTVKTRIQNANFENKVSGVTVVKDLIKNEGATALFKGLTPKVRSFSPRDHFWCHFRIIDAGRAVTERLRLYSGFQMLTYCMTLDLGRRPQAGIQLHPRSVTYPLVLQVCMSDVVAGDMHRRATYRHSTVMPLAAATDAATCYSLARLTT